MKLINYLTENWLEITGLIWQHFVLFFVSTLIAFVLGILISVFITHEKRGKIGKVILTVTAMALSVPSIAVVALVFLLVGIGFKPAVISLVIYSLVPIIFNTTSGFLSVDSKIIEAAKGQGFTDRQILVKIKFPIAFPVIMAGLRNAAIINIGTATVASIIGGGGLGDLIFKGLKLNKDYLIIIGAVLAALMAIIVDMILENIEKHLTSKGLRNQ